MLWTRKNDGKSAAIKLRNSKFVDYAFMNVLRDCRSTHRERERVRESRISGLARNSKGE